MHRGMNFMETSRNAPPAPVPDVATLPAWFSFRLGAVSRAGDRSASVRETLFVLNPFATLTRLTLQRFSPAPAAVIVAPMSGHYGIFLYDLVEGLLPGHDVYVIDWTNARHIRPDAGPFHYEDMIESVVDALRLIDRRAHLIGLCQSAVPAIAAATALHRDGEPCAPASLILMGGPVDPFANETQISATLAVTPLWWLEHDLIETVPQGCDGAGRQVYPAHTQQARLLVYLSRQMHLQSPIARKTIQDDGRRPDQFPILRLLTAVKDIPAAAFLESIAATYKRRAIWDGSLQARGRRIVPQEICELPVLTIEAPYDNVAAPGQTAAAHTLFRSVPSALHAHHLLSDGDHFSLGHGALCRNEVVPAISAFADFAECRQHTGQRPRAGSQTPPCELEQPNRRRDYLDLLQR